MEIRNSHRGKKKLLIIDPQNDFSDPNPYTGRKGGSLAVPGATKDYAKIIQFLEKYGIDEVHVSLDSHSTRHIGHPGFWVVHDEKNGQWIDATNVNGLTILKIDLSNTRTFQSCVNMKAQEYYNQMPLDITGYNIVTGTTNKFLPRIYNKRQYDKLIDYVRNYLVSFITSDESTEASVQKLQPWIWPDHCIMDTPGHKVADELEHYLQEWINKKTCNRHEKKLCYHTKGRNNLVEMYSILSGECPMADQDIETLSTYIDCDCRNEADSAGQASYIAACQNLSLNTKMNYGLLHALFKDDATVYVCGEAKTHCVKSTVMDCMKYIKLNEGFNFPDQLVLLANMTSPIPQTPDDIEALVKAGGGIVWRPELRNHARAPTYITGR